MDAAVLEIESILSAGQPTQASLAEPAHGPAPDAPAPPGASAPDAPVPPESMESAAKAAVKLLTEKRCSLCFRHRPIKEFGNPKDECCKECSKNRSKRMTEIAAKNSEAVDRLTIASLAKYCDDVKEKLARYEEHGVDLKDAKPPHASEMIQNVLAAIGGVEILALHIGANLVTTAPGSAQRTRMVQLITQETRKITELDLQERALGDLEDEEFYKRLEQMTKRMFERDAMAIPTTARRITEVEIEDELGLSGLTSQPTEEQLVEA